MSHRKRMLGGLALLFFSPLILLSCDMHSQKKEKAVEVETAKGKVFSTTSMPVYAEPNGSTLAKEEVSSPAYVLSAEDIEGVTWLRVLLADGRIAWCAGPPKSPLDTKVILTHDSVDATSLPRDKEGQAGFSWLTLSQGAPAKDHRITSVSSDSYLVSPKYIRERGRQIQQAPSNNDTKVIAMSLLPDIRITDGSASGWVTFQDVAIRFQANKALFAGLVNPPFIDSAREAYREDLAKEFSFINLSGNRQESTFTLIDSYTLQQMIVPKIDGDITSLTFWTEVGEDNYVFKLQRKNGDVLAFGFQDADKGIATPYILAYDQRDHNKDGVLDLAIHFLMISGDEETQKTLFVNGAATSVSDLVF